MISRTELIKARNDAATMMREGGIVLSEKEVEEMDVADFGLSHLRSEGAQIASLCETDQIAARVIALFPGQVEPEHWHIGDGDYAGKQETLRVISGELYLFLPGEDTMEKGKIPEGKEIAYSCRHELVMRPTDTITLEPGVKHWFQGGEQGTVFYTISTLATDARDPFSDPNVVRKTVIID